MSGTCVDVIHVFLDGASGKWAFCGNTYSGMRVCESYAASTDIAREFPDDVICAECAVEVALRRRRKR